MEEFSTSSCDSTTRRASNSLSICSNLAPLFSNVIAPIRVESQRCEELSYTSFREHQEIADQFLQTQHAYRSAPFYFLEEDVTTGY